MRAVPPSSTRLLLSPPTLSLAQGHYHLQLHVLSRQQRQRSLLIQALLEHTARHQLIQTVQLEEQGKLQVGPGGRDRERERVDPRVVGG